MTDPSDFSIGDRVRHPVMGDGVVTSTEGAVHVTYDRHDARGNATRGVYDANWFRICGFLTKVEQP
jgi:hypothetical protein